MKLFGWLSGGRNAPAQAKGILPKEVPRGAPGVQRIAAIHGTEVRRNSASGECEVRMWMHS
jgi:hypothetical protein